MFVGSPYSPAHQRNRRLIYFATGLFIGVTSTFANALTNVSVGTIAGSLGLYVAEASALPAIYIAFNASANLALVKARARFGIPEVTVFLLCLYALAALLQFAVPGFAAACIVRAASGMTAAGLTTLAIYYLMQSFPGRLKPLGAVIGVGLPQIGTPLARLVPVDVLAQNGWWGLHAIEFALSLATLALVLFVRLPPSEKAKVFEPLDYVTIALATVGMVLLCQVIGLGRLLWWTDTPWLGAALSCAIALLVAAFLIEATRKRPLVHFEWIGTLGILRFAAVAVLVRLALAEQTYGAVGLLTLGGLDNDQLHTLFATVAAAMALGIAAAAATLSERRIPWQVLVAALIIAAGAWLDSGASALTRPSQILLSQAMLGFGTTLFIGPTLLHGFTRMIQRGGDYLVSFVVTFSVTQNVGGLAGSALLGTYQTIWARNAANVIAGDMAAGDPLAAARIAGGAGTFAGVIADPAQRAAQGAALLAQTMNREAGIIAFTDVFRLVTFMALGTAAFVFANILWARHRRSEQHT